MSRRSPNEPTGPPQGRIAPKRDSAEGTPLNDSDAPSRYLRIAAPALIAVLLLAAWQGLVVAYDVPPYIVPSPKRVFETLVADRGLLANALSVTLGIALTALALATVVGTGIALLFVQSRWIEMSLFPYAVLLQVTPIVAIAPLIIIWVKDTRVALILCAGVVAIFPIISNTTLGLRSADHGLVNLFRMCRASRWQVLVRLRIPSALPYFFGGLRIASGLALIGAVVAEFVAGTGGQGAGLAYQILLSGMQLNIPRLFAALFLIAAAGIALYACTIWLSHVMLSRWHESEAAAPG
jgi:NitT/TauT family transport system permease protein